MPPASAGGAFSSLARPPSQEVKTGSGETSRRVVKSVSENRRPSGSPDSIWPSSRVPGEKRRLGVEALELERAEERGHALFQRREGGLVALVQIVRVRSRLLRRGERRLGRVAGGDIVVVRLSRQGGKGQAGGEKDGAGGLQGKAAGEADHERCSQWSKMGGAYWRGPNGTGTSAAVAGGIARAPIPGVDHAPARRHRRPAGRCGDLPSGGPGLKALKTCPQLLAAFLAPALALATLGGTGA